MASYRLDLNTLHTPHKLAAFVVSILNFKQVVKNDKCISLSSNNLNEDEKDMVNNIYDPFQRQRVPPNNNNDNIRNIAKQDEESSNVYNVYNALNAAEQHEIEYSDCRPIMSERNILFGIAKVLYEHSWNGEMISLSTQFSRSEYNALLNVANIATNSYISNLVWKIFSALQKPIGDLTNENRQHIKWYWWDSNDWKWIKYNVIICEWITIKYQLYLNNNNNQTINFQQCQETFQKNHKQLFGDDDIKRERISIDPYLEENNEYNHYLVIEKDELNDGNVILWHKTTNDGFEYYREIRLAHKLFDTKKEMIANKYQQNPSPFAIPSQLTF